MNFFKFIYLKIFPPHTVDPGIIEGYTTGESRKYFWRIQKVGFIGGDEIPEGAYVVQRKMKSYKKAIFADVSYSYKLEKAQANLDEYIQKDGRII